MTCYICLLQRKKDVKNIIALSVFRVGMWWREEAWVSMKNGPKEEICRNIHLCSI